jgi:hypothetical protein
MRQWPRQRVAVSPWVKKTMGEEKLRAMLQESLAVATRTQAMKPSERSVSKDTMTPSAGLECA